MSLTCRDYGVFAPSIFYQKGDEPFASDQDYIHMDFEKYTQGSPRISDCGVLGSLDFYLSCWIGYS